MASEPISNGLLADLFEEKERGKAYGAIRSIGTLAGLFITLGIGLLSGVANGWRYGLFIMGGMSILSGLMILLMVKEPKRQTALDAADVGRFKFSDAVILLKYLPSCCWPSTCCSSPA